MFKGRDESLILKSQMFSSWFYSSNKLSGYKWWLWITLNQCIMQKITHLILGLISRGLIPNHIRRGFLPFIHSFSFWDYNIWPMVNVRSLLNKMLRIFWAHILSDITKSRNAILTNALPIYFERVCHTRAHKSNFQKEFQRTIFFVVFCSKEVGLCIAQAWWCTLFYDRNTKANANVRVRRLTIKE